MIFCKLKLHNPACDTVALNNEFMIQGTKEAALAARETWKQTSKMFKNVQLAIEKKYEKNII